METDKRRVPRVKVKVKARYSSSQNEIEGIVTSISESGLFLYSTRLDPEGTQARIEFPIAGLNHKVHATGEVIYVGFQDGLRGMGLRFNRLTDEDREAIVKFVRNGDGLAQGSGSAG